MTINPQHTGNDMFDVLEGSVSNHFAQIESVLLKNECINGQYNLTSAASYASNTPVDTPGFTKVCISTNGSNIADLENSYIEADIDFTLRYTGTNHHQNDSELYRLPDPANLANALAGGSTPLTKYFVGFKQSLDALERYDIYCNSQLIYSQPFVGPESTILMAGLNDTIIQNSPFVYTSFHNASTMDSNVCGVYVDLANISPNADFTIRIPVKINIHQFLLLSPIHYLPSFCGRWEIQLYFGSKNLVMCPVNPHSYFTLTRDPAVNNGCIDKLLDEIVHTVKLDTNNPNRSIGWANYFTQINCEFPVYNRRANAGDPINWATMKFTCAKATLRTCIMNLTQFQLKYEIYHALLQRYIENPLIIPTNTISYQRFAHSSGDQNNDSEVHGTANLPVENIDALFVLLPEDDNQQTCYYQPYLTNVRMSIGEFGIRPQRHMDTFNSGDSWNNRRFITYLLDALNLENSQISAMNKDFSNSVLPHVIEYSGQNLATRNRSWVGKNMMNKQYDSSHFIIGIPLSQVGFQSGCVSSPNSNINFQFDAHKENFPMTNGRTKVFKGGIIVMFLTDAALMIQVQQNTDQPLVRLSSKSIV